MVCALWAVGCGKAVDHSSSVDAAADDGGDDDGAIDAGDGEVDAGPDLTGEIYVFSRNYTDQNGTLVLGSTATAAFGDYRIDDCTVVLAGAKCQVLDCTSREPGVTVSAGTILIEGDVTEDTLVPEGGVYAPLEISGLFFSDGDAVSATAIGDEVPQFSATADAPFHIGFTGGVPTSAGPVTILASQDWDLFWDSIDPDDTVRIGLVGPRSRNGVRRQIDCSVPAGDEQVALTSTALGMLPLGEIAFEARVEQSLTIEAGDYAVAVKAAVVMRSGPSAKDNWASGIVLLGR